MKVFKNFEAFVDVICGGGEEVDHVYDDERAGAGAAGSNDGLLCRPGRFLLLRNPP